MINKISVGFVLFLLVGSAAAQPAVVNYSLSMEAPHTHYFEVGMSLTGVDVETLDFKMPVWTPGSYLIREFSRNVEAFRPEDNDGAPLEFYKLNKNTWRVRLGEKDEVRITYKVYAFERSVRTSFLDESHAFVSGTSVFMFVEGYQDLPVSLIIHPHASWRRTSSGLKKVADQPQTFEAPDYDTFVDSPIEIGNHEVIRFDAAGGVHEVAMYGKVAYDKERLVEDLTAIIERSVNIFGENPNDYYLFIIHNLDNRGGGLEHLNSTVLHVDRWAYMDTGDYIGFLSLAAHEYFHLWWVKRARPAALGPFDYNEENYTTLLWVMEGFTSYYDELLLRRTGHLTELEYLQKLSGSIGYIENQPGEEVQPVAMASFDAWIKAYRPNENSYNTTVSYYTKGSILACLFDLSILKASKGEYRLDDVVRYLYETYYKKEKRGFTEEEFKQAIEKYTRKPMDEFFDNYVHGIEGIDYNHYFNHAGLELVDLGAGSKRPLFGINAADKNGKTIVETVVRGTAAYKGGINAKDEIISIDGYRVDAEKINELISYKTPGDTVSIVLAREGLIKELKIKLEASEMKSYRLIKQVDPSPSQRKVYEKWLNVKR